MRLEVYLLWNLIILLSQPTVTLTLLILPYYKGYKLCIPFFCSCQILTDRSREQDAITWPYLGCAQLICCQQHQYGKYTKHRGIMSFPTGAWDPGLQFPVVIENIDFLVRGARS